MLQIIIQGRGGQGAQTAGNLLAQAYFAQGRQVQAFSSYGGARRGTPVSSFIRVDDRPVRLRCDIERADAILCFDVTLLEGRLLGTARPDTLIVVNSARSAAEFRQLLPGYRVIPVDALASLGIADPVAALDSLATATSRRGAPATTRSRRRPAGRSTERRRVADRRVRPPAPALAGRLLHARPSAGCRPRKPFAADSARCP